jgi:hypothetical protein
MTEQEWLNCTDCDAMLRFLQGSFANRVLARLRLRGESISHRKLRLYYCACARDNPVFADYRDLAEAVDLAEHYADGEPVDMALARQRLAAYPPSLQAFLTWRACNTTPRFMGFLFLATDAIGAVMSYLIELHPFDNDLATNLLHGRKENPTLLRDIFGNPFRPAALDDHWLTWNNAVTRELAQRIYDERSFGDLPILADALEEAGCREEAILSHCRETTAHARGCWLVDLILGKR